MDFNYKPLDWAAEGVEPPESVKKEGWLAGHRPPSAYFNYKWRADYLTQNELQQKLANLDATHAADKAALEAAVVLKAPIDSPTFTGSPKAPTPLSTANGTEVATTEWVKTLVGGIDLSGVQEKTLLVSNANLNTLLGDRAYMCVGTLSNAPIPNTYCLLRSYDTAGTDRVLQVCYVPSLGDNSVRTFVRSVNGGVSFGTWRELVTVSELDNQLGDLLSLIKDNQFTNEATLEATNKAIFTFFIENFADLDSVNLAGGSGEAAITAIYDSDAHHFLQLETGSTTPETIIYSTVQVVTGPNNNAWVYLDFDTGSSSSASVKFEISRDNGTTWTELAHNTVTSISSQPAGVQVIYRVTLTGQLLLHNLAWGLK